MQICHWHFNSSGNRRRLSRFWVTFGITVAILSIHWECVSCYLPVFSEVEANLSTQRETNLAQRLSVCVLLIYNGGRAAVPMGKRRQRFTCTNVHARPVQIWKLKVKKKRGASNQQMWRMMWHSTTEEITPPEPHIPIHLLPGSCPAAWLYLDLEGSLTFKFHWEPL